MGAVLTALAACEGTLGLDTTANANLAFAVNEADGGLLGLGSTAPNEMSEGGHTLVVTSATMTASELELKGLSDGSGSGSGSGSGEATSKFETGPLTITLPVEGGVSREISAQIGAGTYDKFEMDVEHVRLQGTYDGAPFDVTLLVNDELELMLVPPLVIADGTSSTAVTVALDLQAWFRSAAGGLIDPRTILSDTSIAATLRSNIRGSFEAFEDHDRSGDDD
jgi:hypothetical protein